MLTNLYLEEVLKVIPGFRGVFSSDEVPKLEQKFSSLIINFDEKTEPGSHYIALFRKQKKCFYFDPLKLNFLPVKVGEYLYQYNTIYDLSNNIQSFQSTYCGFYCILFIISLNIGEWYWKQNIIPKFKPRKKSNDKICINLICKSIKVLSKKLRKNK